MRTELYQKHAATLARVAALCQAELKAISAGYTTHISLHRAGGTALSISHSYQDRTGNRLTIHPAWDTGRTIEEEGNPPRLENMYRESITLDFTRPPASLARDLERRAWGLAREFAASRYKQTATATLAATVKETRLDQLRDILGTGNEWSGRSDQIQIGALELCTHYLEQDQPRHGFTLKINVKNWPAVLMMARILAAEKNLSTPESKAS